MFPTRACTDKAPGVINAAGGWVLLTAVLLSFELEIICLEMNHQRMGNHIDRSVSKDKKNTFCKCKITNDKQWCNG